jgi:hypothetical protein
MEKTGVPGENYRPVASQCVCYVISPKTSLTLSLFIEVPYQDRKVSGHVFVCYVISPKTSLTLSLFIEVPYQDKKVRDFDKK